MDLFDEKVSAIDAELRKEEAINKIVGWLEREGFDQMEKSGILSRAIGQVVVRARKKMVENGHGHHG